MPNNESLFIPFLRRLSYGTIEIETDISKVDFDKAIDTEKLPKNMSRQAFHEAINTFFSHRWLWRKIIEHEELLTISEEGIKSLHADFMRGVYDNAGFYATTIRVMGKLESLQTTLPEDIPEEMNRWVYKCANAKTLEEIAKAHAYFIAIHPFGDGNVRVSRALVMAQCLNARLMPPVFDGKNRAIYYLLRGHGACYATWPIYTADSFVS